MVHPVLRKFTGLYTYHEDDLVLAACQILQAPKGGWFDIGYNQLGSMTLRYACHPGYKLVGASVISCHRGQWLGRVPQCKIDIGKCSYIAQ